MRICNLDGSLHTQLIGVGFGSRDVTLEASQEAKHAGTARKSLAHAAPAV